MVFSPFEYLCIFAEHHKELSTEDKKAVLAKTRQIVALIGEWPFEWWLRGELWAVEHRMGALNPMFRLCQKIGVIFKRSMRLLRHIFKNGVGLQLAR